MTNCIFSMHYKLFSPILCVYAPIQLGTYQNGKSEVGKRHSYFMGKSFQCSTNTFPIENPGKSLIDKVTGMRI